MPLPSVVRVQIHASTEQYRQTYEIWETEADKFACNCNSAVDLEEDKAISSFDNLNHNDVGTVDDGFGDETTPEQRRISSEGALCSFCI